MYYCYDEDTLNSLTQKSLVRINEAEQIIQEFRDQGYTLTLRQLYYQFVGRGLIENTERSYKNLGALITKARLAGLVSWEAIEDRNREVSDFWYREDDQHLIDILPENIRFDRWARQDRYCEVWVEKEALGNVIERACEPWLVPHLSCKGYLSASEAWRAGRRLKEKIAEGKECVIIHLGDHDPSGIDMTRDNRERLTMFAESFNVGVQRIALNWDQVEQYQPPPNPAKTTDRRADKYIEQFGNESWELDALRPEIIVELVQNAIKPLIDLDKWHEVDDAEEAMKADLRKLGENWDHIKSEILVDL